MGLRKSGLDKTENAISDIKKGVEHERSIRWGFAFDRLWKIKDRKSKFERKNRGKKWGNFQTSKEKPQEHLANCSH